MTYTFQSNVSLMTLEGITPEYSYVMLFECDQEGSKIKNNKIEPIEKGKEYNASGSRKMIEDQN